MNIEVLDGTSRKAIVISLKIGNARDYESKLLISYDTPVAFVIDGSGFVGDSNWSATTKRHIHKFLKTERVETHSVVNKRRLTNYMSRITAELDDLLENFNV